MLDVRKIRLTLELRNAGISDSTVLSAIEKIPREIFIPDNFRNQAYENIALPIGEDQTILDYFFSENKIHIVMITQNDFKVYNKNFSYKHFAKLTEEIRKTLIPLNGEILPFAVKKSHELNKNLFLFLKDELKAAKKLIIIPDGPLNSLPLHVLATKQEKNCLDFI